MTDKSAFGNASAYENYMGRWSRPVARKVVGWLNIPTGSTWLDVGAGTGILTQVILEQASPQKVLAIDISENYLSYARQTITDERVEFKVGDASQLAFDSLQFDIAIAGLVLNFVPSAEAMIRGMKEGVKQDGIVAAYVWDYTDGMEMLKHFWDSAIAVDASAQAFNAATQYSLCNPDSLQSLSAQCGLKDIEVTSVDIEMNFANFDDFWLPFLQAQGSVSKYLRSLDETGRNRLQDQLRQALPINNDDTIHLTARAWVVKGIR
jgi:SAM-dependent methyltransferase